jgi:hypothetical protein
VGLLASNAAVMAEAVSFAEVVSALSGPGVAFLVLGLILSGHLIPKGSHDQMKQDRDLWREVALGAVTLGEAAVGQAEKR